MTKRAFFSSICLLFLGIHQLNAVSRTFNIQIAGTLSDSLTIEENKTITKITIIGKIDVRDFRTLRDKLIKLEEIDISKTSINSYTELSTTYPANKIPPYAFYDYITDQRNSTLTSIQLPLSISSIGEFAFAYCDHIKFISIPTYVTSIENRAFYACTRLSAITLSPNLESIGVGTFSNTINISNPIIIPSKVSTIGGSAFSNCSGLFVVNPGNNYFTAIDSMLFDKSAVTLIQCPTSKRGIITLPPTTNTINSFAFAACKNLASIIIPPSVTTIGTSAFPGCSGTVSVENSNQYFSSSNGILYNIDKSTLIFCPSSKEGNIIVPSSVKTIGRSAFSLCNKLKDVNLSSSITSIEDDAFAGCDSLNNLVLPTTLKTIGYNAFSGCISLKGRFIIPKLITTINDYTFEKCKGITGFDLPINLASISRNAFLGCSGVVDTLKIPASTFSIKSASFAGCSGIIAVDQTNPNYKSLDGMLFDKNLTTLMYCPTQKRGELFIPKTTTTIEERAFLGCENLIAITLTESLKAIGKAAFQGCSSLISFVSSNTTPISLINNIDVFTDVNTDSCILYVPKGTISNYMNSYKWNEFKNIKEGTYTNINNTKRTLLNSIYPTFISDGFRTIGVQQLATIEIYNTNGQLELQKRIENDQYISTKLLRKGIHIVRIKSGICTQSIKIEKIR